jgi:hypothetical protein
LRENALLGLSATSISLPLSTSVVGLVVHGALGVGAEVLEGAVGRVLGLLGAVGDALVVGVGGSRAGLGLVLALGLGGLAALVGGRHDVWCFVVRIWGLRWLSWEAGVKVVLLGLDWLNWVEGWRGRMLCEKANGGSCGRDLRSVVCVCL